MTEFMSNKTKVCFAGAAILGVAGLVLLLKDKHDFNNIEDAVEEIVDAAEDAVEAVSGEVIDTANDINA